MTYEQITSLLDKGFSPDQITMLARADPTEPEKPETPEPETPEPEQPEQENPETPEPEKPETPEPLKAELDGVRAEMAQLRDAIQKQNILTKTIDSLGGSSEDVENILAGLIRPALPDENGGKK